MHGQNHIKQATNSIIVPTYILYRGRRNVPYYIGFPSYTFGYYSTLLRACWSVVRTPLERAVPNSSIPSSLQYIGYRVSFLGVNGKGVVPTTYHPLPKPASRMGTDNHVSLNPSCVCLARNMSGFVPFV